MTEKHYGNKYFASDAFFICFIEKTYFYIPILLNFCFQTPIYEENRPLTCKRIWKFVEITLKSHAFLCIICNAVKKIT